MTPQEMSAHLIAAVAKYEGSSFVDLVKAAGPEGEGALTLERKENLVLWSGVSQMFSDALDLALEKIEYRPTQPLVYHVDGQRLGLPLAKYDRPYKRPRWLPVAFYMKKPLANRQ